MSLEHAVIERAAAAGRSIAVAESLTAGLVCARLADVPGASTVLRGGVVAYAADLKASLLGVSEDLLREQGTVDAEVACQMASGVRLRLGADIGLATTGVAGPGDADGHPAGTVHIAVDHLGDVIHRPLSLPGGRRAIRMATVDVVFELLLERL